MKKIRVSKKKLFEAIQGTVEELSSTGTGATMTPGAGEQQISPKAFKKTPNVKEITAVDNTKAQKLLNIIKKYFPNTRYREAILAMMIDPYVTYENLYNLFIRLTGKRPEEFELAENTTEEELNTDHVFAALNNPRIDPEVKALLIQAYRKGDITAETVVQIVNKLTSPKSENVAGSVTKKGIDQEMWDKTVGYKSDLAKDIYSENYSRFKTEIKTRNKPQQMHEAVKAVNRRLYEVNRILEYVSQLKTELSEGDAGFKYNNRTTGLLQKMKKQVAEAYTKLKKIQ